MEVVRDELTAMQRVHLSAKDGSFQVVTKSTAEQRKLLKKLGLTPQKIVQKVQLGVSAA